MAPDAAEHVVEQDGVVVRFMLGGQDTAETVDNVDAHIFLPDGSHRYATFFTTVAIDRILRKDARTGETGGGRYFWCSDQVIVPAPGIPAMMAAVAEMVASGDITAMCGLVDADNQGAVNEGAVNEGADNQGADNQGADNQGADN